MTATIDPAAPSPSRPPIWRRRWAQVIAAFALALVLFLALFDWNLLRGPVERMISRSTGRPVTIGVLDVKLALSPRIIFTDISIGNADWAGDEPLAHARELEFSVRLLSLLTDEIVLPYLGLTEGAASLVRDAEGRANWKFDRAEEEPSSRTVTVQTLSLKDASLSYNDAKLDIAAELDGATRNEGQYETRLDFKGRWRGSTFAGTADTGSVLSLTDTSEPFPMRVALRMDRTSINAEGTVADLATFRDVDAQVAVSGPSLSALYPAIRLALPETPAYKISGHLTRSGDAYAYTGFKGTIGNTDIAGDARYELREPRPLLTATLKSRRLDLADLGPLVGLQRRATATPGAKATPAVLPPGKVFPEGDFNLERLNAMDADVQLTADSLRIPEQVPLEDFSTHIKLNGGVLVLDPMNFGFAGGDLVSTLTLDARSNPISAKASIDLRRVRLGKLFPTVERLNNSAGLLGGQIRLAGRGNSVSDMLGTANGTVTAGMTGGTISELGVWLVNLNGGELVPLLFGGDRPTQIRCAAAAFDVKGGVGTMQTFVFDTDESRIDGEGTVRLGAERLDITLTPLSKKRGILSLRGPVRIYGTFRNADFAVSSQTILRGVGAVALGLVNPLLALIPLLETGPGEDANCRQVLAEIPGAIKQSGKSVEDAPLQQRSTSAPIVDVPAKRDGPPAPIVDARAKK